MEKELLTVQELADRLRVNINKVYSWRKDGMPAVVPAPLRFDYNEVTEWLKKRGE